mgnify:CR=1
KKIFKKMNKSFVSSMDSFLQNFDQSIHLANHKKKEIEKSKNIAKKRDQATQSQ